MDSTLALLKKAHTGDKLARDTLFEENIGLVWSIVKRFRDRGMEMEDLFQVGSIGLLKAVDHFDLNFDVKFSTYAVPVITGEIQRFLRDNGVLKVSRSLKSLSYRIYQAKERLESVKGKNPSIDEIADYMQIPAEEIVEALESTADVESLSKPIYQNDSDEISLSEKLVDDNNHQEQVLNCILLAQILEHLTGRERQILYMRYYMDMTQTEIGKKLGVSQVQVSRMEKKIMESIRGKL